MVTCLVLAKYLHSQAVCTKKRNLQYSMEHTYCHMTTDLAADLMK